MKKITFGLLALFLILFVTSTFLVTRTSDQSTRGKNATNAKTAKVTAIYFADLEYDPRVQTITQLRTGKTTGKLQRASKPVSTTSGQFIYKLDVHSKQNKLVEEGWEALPTKNITTAKGTLGFRVNAQYAKDAIVRVLTTDNRLLWAGVMQ